MFGIRMTALTLVLFVLGPHLSPPLSCAAAAVAPSLLPAPPPFEPTIFSLNKRSVRSYYILGWTIIWETNVLILPPTYAISALSTLFGTTSDLAISRRQAAADRQPAFSTQLGAFTFTMFSAAAVDGTARSGIGIPWRLIEAVAKVLLRTTQLGAPAEVKIRCLHPAAPNLIVWVLVKIAEAAPAA